MSGIDLKSVRDRVADLPCFGGVEDTISAADAMQNASAPPRTAFVSTAAERAGKGEFATGYHRQRVQTTISILFCMAAERADLERADTCEEAKNLTRDHLSGWQPDGADSPFQYQSYAIVLNADGLIWAELLFSAPYHLIKRS